MPFSQIMVLWTTGIAACIVGGGCLVVSAVSLYRIMSRLGFGRAARVAGLAVLLANPSLLYAFTTALTEPVLIATTLACIAGLAGWALDERRLSGGELAVFAGIPAGLAVLTRYEGWAMMVSGSIFVAIVVLRRGDSWRRALTMVFSFCSPAIASVTWWLAYNWGTYGDLFEFLTGKYSARAFAETLIEQGTLTTKGNPGLSLWVFNWAVLETSGLFPIIVGLDGTRRHDGAMGDRQPVVDRLVVRHRQCLPHVQSCHRAADHGQRSFVANGLVQQQIRAVCRPDVRAGNRVVGSCVAAPAVEALGAGSVPRGGRSAVPVVV